MGEEEGRDSAEDVVVGSDELRVSLLRTADTWRPLKKFFTEGRVQRPVVGAADLHVPRVGSLADVARRTATAGAGLAAVSERLPLERKGRRHRMCSPIRAGSLLSEHSTRSSMTEAELTGEEQQMDTVG